MSDESPSKLKDLLGWVAAIGVGVVVGGMVTSWQGPVGPGGDGVVVEPEVEGPPERDRTVGGRALGVAVLVTDAGLEVREVFEGSAAARAELAVGDVIEAVDGRPAVSEAVLLDALGISGDTLDLVVVRGEERLELAVRLLDEGSFEEKLAARLIENAVGQLLGVRRRQGLWPHYQDAGRPSVATTALVAYALAQAEVDAAERLWERAVDALLRHQEPDGGLTDPGELVPHRVYASALLAQALEESEDPGHMAARAALGQWLRAAQVDEGHGYDPFDARYGAWSYYEGYASARLRTDISTARYALQGLAAAGTAEDDPVWYGARLFLDLTQNQTVVSDPDTSERRRELALRDGGFGFTPRMSKAGEDAVGEALVVYRSYGSATCDGLLGRLVVEGVDLREHAEEGAPAIGDARILAALRWLARHYTLEGNPGFEGQTSGWDQGVYFYYLAALAEGLHRAGVWDVVDGEGKRHVWAAELVRVLANARERAGERFENPSGLMHEDSPTVAAAFAVVALSAARARLALGGGSTLEAGPPPPPLPPEPELPVYEDGLVAQGKAVFRRGGCVGCHVDGQRANGPSLVGVGERYSGTYASAEVAAERLKAFLRAPRKGGSLTGESFSLPMPPVTEAAVGEDDMEALVAFLLSRRGSRPVSR